MCPWIASLPEHVHLPLFHYSRADLEACQDEDVIREALSIRESAQAVYEVQESLLLMADRVQHSCLLQVQAFLKRRKATSLPSPDVRGQTASCKTFIGTS